MHVVSNGYDPELAPEPQLRGPDAEKPLTFGYIGTVSRKVPLAEFNAGWTLARTRHPDLRDAEAHIWGHLGFFSLPSPDLLRLIQDHSEQGVRHLGPAPKTQVREIYGGFDALLLLLGAGRYVTSGKVFEYAASALPIVSVHDPSNAASEVLRGYPLWFPVSDLSAETIADALGRAAHAARTAQEPVRRKCAEFAHRFARDLQLEPRVLALREHVAQRRTEPTLARDGAHV
jgi:glycosyltransferase involved in cell wall biosynthesis